jgi:hemolysin III
MTATIHFDSARGLHYTKPRMRGWLHLVWFGLSLAVGPWAVLSRHGPIPVIAMTIYLIAVAGLFGTSALYHCGTWSVAAGQRLQRLDPVMILFLIAGTATPAFLRALPGLFGRIATASMWTLAITVAILHLRRMDVPEKLIGATFLILGWIGVLVIPAVWITFGPAAAVLLLVGGLLYTAGAICYHRRTPDPYPKVFGYHEVFHAFVCAAATCQFIAIALFLR